MLCFCSQKISVFHSSAGASDGSFYHIFNQCFYHLEKLLKIQSTKRFCQLGHSVVPFPNLNAPKGPSHHPKSIMPQFQICYHSHLNVSWKMKTNISFRGQAWVRPSTKCWVKGFILPHRCHAPNFYRRLWHTLAN